MTFYTLQFLRFIAASLVLLFHLGIVHSGYKGVDIFFVISGFIMYEKLFLSVRSKAFTFFINRLTKIFFLYWFILFLLYIVRPFAIDFSLVNTLLLLPGHHQILGVSWSLSFELYFYFLIGSVAYLVPQRYCKPVLLFILIASAANVFLLLFLHVHIKGTYFLFGKFTCEFFLGILSAFLSEIIFTSVKTRVIVFLALLSLLLLLVIDVPSGRESLSASIYAILSMLLICFMTIGEKRIAVPAKIAVPVKLLGDASYAIYLAGAAIDIFFFHGRDKISIAVIIIVTLVVSVFLNQVIENRALKYLRKKIYRLG